MKKFRQLAIIGPTASGKTALAVETARRIDAHILSLDSLSIYKEIDIVSAKPSLRERKGITHFGIDLLSPDENFDVTIFIKLYEELLRKCMKEKKNLVIVGGTGFYLKMLMTGISPLPSLTSDQKQEIRYRMRSPQRVYETLTTLDPDYMMQIRKEDTYRIEKALGIYLASGMLPSLYYRAYPPRPSITLPLPIYEIVWERTLLRQRIALRTRQMLNAGMIDEIIGLEHKYTRTPNCMKAIGIKETLSYLDGRYDRETLIEKITVNTGRLAKRQRTFNHSQFENVTQGSLEKLEKILL